MGTWCSKRVGCEIENQGVNEKTLILGAGYFQLPGIKKAVEAGYHVITLDYLPENIGHKYSHQSINCSTTNAEGVLAAARLYHVDSICTFSSDVAVLSVAYACEKLGLPGVSLHAADIMSLKHHFRAFLKEHKFPCPTFAIGASIEELGDYTDRLQYPLVFKPVDSSGSRGVTKVMLHDPVREFQSFQHAKFLSRKKLVCVEEFIEGIEVGGDGILINGKFAFLAITQKHMNGFIVTGHSLPTGISNEDQRRVRVVLEECCVALGYLNGPLNFDVMVTPSQIVILEMSPRNGGNGIPAVISRSTGFDVEKATLLLSFGVQPIFAETYEGSNAGSWIFGSPHHGILKHMSSIEEVQQVVPEVFDLYQIYLPGEKVERFDHNGKLLGYALFAWGAYQSYHSIVRKVRTALRLEIEAME